MVELFYSLSGRVRVVRNKSAFYVAERCVAPDTWARVALGQFGQTMFATLAEAVDVALGVDHADCNRVCANRIAWDDRDNANRAERRVVVAVMRKKRATRCRHDWRMADVRLDGQDFKGCDWCGDPAKRCRYGDVARGATGRHCVVMARCDACAEGKEIVDVDDARERATVGSDYADF